MTLGAILRWWVTDALEFLDFPRMLSQFWRARQEVGDDNTHGSVRKCSRFDRKEQKNIKVMNIGLADATARV